MGWEFEPGAVDLQGGSLFEGCQMTRRDLGLSKPCCCHSSWPMSLQRSYNAVAKNTKEDFKKSNKLTRGCSVSLQARVFFFA